MIVIDWIGYAAGALTTLSFLPQSVKAWRSRSTKDISMLMFMTLTIGIICWLVYGILLGDYPLIIANAFTLAIAASIIIAKVKFD